MMGVAEFKSSIHRVAPNLVRDLERVGLVVDDADLERILAAARVAHPTAKCDDILRGPGELWRTSRAEPLWHAIAPSARAFIAGAVAAAVNACELTADQSLKRANLSRSPTLSYASFFLAVELFDQGRSLRLRAPERAAECFRETARILQNEVQYQDLNEESQRHALGRIGAATVMLSRIERVPLVDLLEAHRLFVKSLERGNDGPEAIGYLLALRLDIFQTSGDASFLEAILKNKYVSARSSEPEVAAALATISARLALHVLEQARATPRAWEERVSALKRSADGYLGPIDDTAGADVRAIRAFGRAFWRCIAQALEDRDPTSCRLPPAISDPAYRIEQAMRECEAYGGVSQAISFVTAADECLASESLASDPTVAALRLRCLRFLARVAPSRDQASVKHASVELAHQVAAGDLEDERGSAFAIQYLAAQAFDRTLTGDARVLLSDYLSRFARRYETATWPLLTVSRLAERGYLPASGCEIDGARLLNWQSDAAIALAAARVVRDESAVRSVIGHSTSRRTTYIVEGASSRDAASRFVFKPCDRASAVLEERRLRGIGDAIDAQGLTSRFTVPRVVCVVEGAELDVLVLEREDMPTLAESLGEPPTVRLRRLRDSAQFLALIHGFLLDAEGGGGSPKRTWADLRSQLKHPPISLKPEAIDEVLAEFRRLGRTEPVLPKRDAHPSNWLSGSGRVCAIDPCGRGTRPLLLELAQLLEDGCLLDVSDQGFVDRLDLARHYLRCLDVYTPSPLSPEAASDEILRPCLGTQMLNRAIFLLNRSYRPESDRVERLRAYYHGQALLDWLATRTDVGSAARLSAMIAKHLRERETRRTRASRTLAYMLRHDTALVRDARGWSPISEVESRLRAAVGSSEPTTVVEVAAHPAETRFQVNEDHVRAGYGHTVGLVEADYRDQPPPTLFHGTIEANLESIRATGLKPMGRDFVHLVEAEDWAHRIGARRGPSHVVQIDTAKAQAAGVRFFSVADGMWLSTELPASTFTSV